MLLGYARVSTANQRREGNSLEAQAEQLRSRGSLEVYLESYTGATKERPVFASLLKRLKKGDTLMVCKLDRFARNTIDGLTVIKDLLDRGISVHILNMGLIDNTATGKLILTIMLGFAEFERDMIIERTQAGKEIAKKRPDFKEGRPRKFTDHQLQQACALVGKESYKEIERLTKISSSTILREMRKLRRENIE